MSEILGFPKEKRMTAVGRFLMTVRQQEEERIRERASSNKLTVHSVESARKELRLIFSGDNEAEAEQLYQEGLMDIMQNGTSLIDTTAAQFYIHVQQLTEVANSAHDRYPEQANSQIPK